MKLALISDIHGNRSALIPLEPVDVLVMAGDYVPLAATMGSNTADSLKLQADWVIGRLYTFMDDLISSGHCKHIVYTWGNHDWIGQYHDWKTGLNTLLPPPPPNCHLLVDSGVTIQGVKFYGSPWQPEFYNWAFNANETFLESKWNDIPEGTDVLVLHGPPNGYGDRVGNTHVGSKSLTKRLYIVEPRLVVCGHIHVGAGSYSFRGNNQKTIFVCNVSAVDEQYKVKRGPVIWSLDNADITPIEPGDSSTSQ